MANFNRQKLWGTYLHGRSWPVTEVTNCFINDCNESKEYMQCINQLHQSCNVEKVEYMWKL